MKSLVMAKKVGVVKQLLNFLIKTAFFFFAPSWQLLSRHVQSLKDQASIYLNVEIHKPETQVEVSNIDLKSHLI